MCAYRKAILTIGMQLHAMSLRTILVHFVSIQLINKCQSGIDFIFTSERAIYSTFMKISVPSQVFRGKTKWKWWKVITLECQLCFRNNKIREFDTLERQTMGVNKYASTFPMASCNKKRCNHRKKTWGKKIWKYAIVFASTQLRITRLRKYPIGPKAYLGRCGSPSSNPRVNSSRSSLGSTCPWVWHFTWINSSCFHLHGRLCIHWQMSILTCHISLRIVSSWYNILNDFQHGFRAKRSCEAQILTFYHKLAASHRQEDPDHATWSFWIVDTESNVPGWYKPGDRAHIFSCETTTNFKKCPLITSDDDS